MQDKIAAFYNVRPTTKILCIGNSQTGCTWEDSEGLGIEVKWISATSIPLYWMRLAEIERRCMLGNVDTVIVDCCAPARHVWTERVARDVARTLPVSWRYIFDLPSSLDAMLKEIFIPLRREWCFCETPPYDDRQWSALSQEAQMQEIHDVYDGEGYMEPEDAEKISLLYLEKMRDICNRNGKEFIVFFAPLVENNPNRKSSMLESWQKKLKQKGFLCFDYRYDCRDEDFRDSHHLSWQGRHKFTISHFEQIRHNR